MRGKVKDFLMLTFIFIAVSGLIEIITDGAFDFRGMLYTYVGVLFGRYLFELYRWIKKGERKVSSY